MVFSFRLGRLVRTSYHTSTGGFAWSRLGRCYRSAGRLGATRRDSTFPLGLFRLSALPTSHVLREDIRDRPFYRLVHCRHLTVQPLPRYPFHASNSSSLIILSRSFI